MIKNIGYLILALFILISCNQKSDIGNASISGQFSKLSGDKLYLRELEIRNTILLDSIVIPNDGNFSFNIELSDAGFYLLQINKDNFIPLLVEKGEDVEVFSNSSNFEEGYTIKNSKGSALLKEYETFMIHQKRRVDSIAIAYEESKGTDQYLKTKQILDSIYLEIYSDQQEYVKKFIDKNPGSLASLIVLNRKLGNSKVLNEEKDFIYFHKIDSALSIQYPGNKHVNDHHQRVMEIRSRIFDNYNADKKLQPGKKAPNIVAKDTSGNIISLKQFIGKPVLIYFWAGWNAKSRLDNKTLKYIYPKLTEQNIEIFGFSLDENERVWKGALKLDKLPWIQVSDLRGIDSEVMEAYNLKKELPYYYLIDKDNKIISRNKDVDSVLMKIDKLFF